MGKVDLELVLWAIPWLVKGKNPYWIAQRDGDVLKHLLRLHQFSGVKKKKHILQKEQEKAGLQRTTNESLGVPFNE